MRGTVNNVAEDKRRPPRSGGGDQAWPLYSALQELGASKDTGRLKGYFASSRKKHSKETRVANKPI